MSHRLNPFVEPTYVGNSDTDDITDFLMDKDVISVGPRDPTLINIAAPSDSVWPQTVVLRKAEIALVGLHGGAGVTTLETIFSGSAFDAGRSWPISEDGSEMGVVVVSRTHYAGLEAAESFTQHWGSGSLKGSRLLGLILVDDAPRLIDSQQRAVKRLLKKTPLGAHVPWVESWRYGPPDPQRLPLRIKRIVRAFQNA